MFVNFNPLKIYKLIEQMSSRSVKDKNNLKLLFGHISGDGFIEMYERAVLTQITMGHLCKICVRPFKFFGKKVAQHNMFTSS